MPVTDRAVGSVPVSFKLAGRRGARKLTDGGGRRDEEGERQGKGGGHLQEGLGRGDVRLRGHPFARQWADTKNTPDPPPPQALSILPNKPATFFFLALTPSLIDPDDFQTA